MLKVKASNSKSRAEKDEASRSHSTLYSGTEIPRMASPALVCSECYALCAHRSQGPSVARAVASFGLVSSSSEDQMLYMIDYSERQRFSGEGKALRSARFGVWARRKRFTSTRL